MKYLLILALLFSTPAAAHPHPEDDLVCKLANDCATAEEGTRRLPATRGFKIARKVDTPTQTLQQIRDQLVARDPKDKLIRVIDKALNARLVQ